VKLKAFIKRIIDAAMLLLLPVLMAEILTGQQAHEWLGTGIMMSGFVFEGLPFSGGMITARMLHLFASHWGIILIFMGRQYERCRRGNTGTDGC